MSLAKSVKIGRMLDEQRSKFLTGLQREIIASSDLETGEDIIYRAEVFPYLDSLDVRGRAVLTKISRVTKQVQVRKYKIFGEVVTKEVIKEKVIWEVETSSRHQYFVYWMSIKPFEGRYSAGYLEDLKSEAANRGILLSSELLISIFEPILLHLLDLAKQVKDF